MAILKRPGSLLAHQPHRKPHRPTERKQVSKMVRIRQLFFVVATVIAPIAYVIVETGGGKFP